MKVPFERRPRVSICCALLVVPLFVSADAGAQTKAYVTQPGENVVTVIDTVTGAVTGTLPVGTGPSRTAITRDGTRAYVTNSGSNSVSVIDTAADAVTDTISVGPGPAALAVTPDGKWLYVMTADGVVDVVDTTLRTVAATIPVGSSGDIAISPDGARVYVASGLVHVIDTAANVVVHSFPPRSGCQPEPDQHRVGYRHLAGWDASVRRSRDF